MFELLIIIICILHIFGFFCLGARLIVVEGIKEDVWRIYDLAWLVVCPVGVVMALMFCGISLMVDLIAYCFTKSKLSDWLKSPLFKEKK